MPGPAWHGAKQQSYRTGLMPVEPSLCDQNTDIENSRPEIGARNSPDIAQNRVNRVAETRQHLANSRECRDYFFKLDTAHRDPTGWLRMQSGANPSLRPISLITGKIQGISPILILDLHHKRPILQQRPIVAPEFPRHRNREFINCFQAKSQRATSTTIPSRIFPNG